MYRVIGIGSTKGMTNPYHKPKKPKVSLAKRCLKRCGEGILNLLERIQATVLVLIATLGAPSFYMTLQMLMRPGMATLTSRLHPTVCTVVYSANPVGKTNCTWSSCHEGCTGQEMFRCWHVFVLPYNLTISLSTKAEASAVESAVHIQPMISTNGVTDKLTNGYESKVLPDMSTDYAYENESESTTVFTVVRDYANDLDATEEEGQGAGDEKQMAGKLEPLVWDSEPYEHDMIRLQVNVEGCGYMSCQEWWEKYRKLGSTFKCFASKDRGMAVPEINYKKAATQVVFSLIPLFLTVTSFVLIYLLYCRSTNKNRVLSAQAKKKERQLKFEQAKMAILMQNAAMINGTNKIHPLVVEAAGLNDTAAKEGNLVKKNKGNSVAGGYGKQQEPSWMNKTQMTVSLAG